jgi:hypothetical protein
MSYSPQTAVHLDLALLTAEADRRRVVERMRHGKRLRAAGRYEDPIQRDLAYRLLDDGYRGRLSNFHTLVLAIVAEPESC